MGVFITFNKRMRRVNPLVDNINSTIIITPNYYNSISRILPSGNNLSFTWEAGHVEYFGIIVDGIGKGLPRSVACGNHE